METFPFYGDFTGTLLYGDSFFSRETFSLLSGDFFSLSMETFPLYGDFTGTLRGLYGDSSLWRLFLSMETFSFSMETFPLYEDFTGTLRGLFSMETFLSLETLRGLYGDSSLWIFFSLSGDFFSLFWGQKLIIIGLCPPQFVFY